MSSQINLLFSSGYITYITSLIFSNAGNERQNGAVSDNESEDGEEGDYTVYECPGLAPVRYFKVNA